MKNIQVHIISGFLGSGKTTFITDLLKRKKDPGQWAVIINEFGKISIDSSTLKSSDEFCGEVYELAGGCICCSSQHLFRENLSLISATGRFEKIIIEPSGLGGVEMISELISELPELELMPVLCMVDILSLEHPRLLINLLYRAQILLSDIIVFSRCDMLETDAKKEELIQAFEKYFPNKLHLFKNEFSPCDLLAENLISGMNRNLSKPKPYSAAGLDLNKSVYLEKCYTFEEQTCFDTEKLGELFSRHQSVARAKGHLKSENGWNLFNFTKTRFSAEACSPKRENELVVIYEQTHALELKILEEEILKTII